MHFAHTLRHHVEVFTQEAVALDDFVAHHQFHQLADHGPTFTRCLQKDEVVDGA